MLVNSLHSFDLTSRQLIHPAYQGGAGGVKIPATNNKILYKNDKTLQQKLRKIQAAEASQRNDGS